MGEAAGGLRRRTWNEWWGARGARGDGAWQVFWKVPTAGAGPLPIAAVLPEACAPRMAEGLRFDGAAAAVLAPQQEEIRDIGARH